MNERQKQLVENVKAGRAWSAGIKYATQTFRALERAGVLVKANPGDPVIPFGYGLTLAPEYR